MLDADAIAELVAQGVATIVATCGEDKRPLLTRGWGPMFEDANRVVVGVEAPIGSEIYENIRINGVMAITLARPTSYRSVQFKGPVLAIREPNGEDLVRADAHGVAFAAECERVGLADASRLMGTVTVIVTVAVEQSFDQTPGQGAGQRI